jgi:hypothetical protein
MPDMIGTALHEWASTHCRPLADRMIFMSGGIFTPHVAAYLAKTNNLKIDKPFNVATLMRIVAKHIARTRARH